METLYTALSHSYGLDWLTMFFGVLGSYLIARKDKRGIVCNLVACVCSFTLALLSQQYGFTVSNILTVCIMSQAYINWSREEREGQLIPINERRQDAV